MTTLSMTCRRNNVIKKHRKKNDSYKCDESTYSNNIITRFTKHHKAHHPFKDLKPNSKAIFNCAAECCGFSSTTKKCLRQHAKRCEDLLKKKLK